MPLTYGNGSAACDGHTFIMTLPAFLQGYALRNKLVGGRMLHAKRFNGEFRGRSLISCLRRRSSRQITNLYTRPAARPRVSMQPDTHGMNGLRRLARADECSVVAGRAARPMAYVPDISGREY